LRKNIVVAAQAPPSGNATQQSTVWRQAETNNWIIWRHEICMVPLCRAGAYFAKKTNTKVASLPTN